MFVLNILFETIEVPILHTICDIIHAAYYIMQFYILYTLQLERANSIMLV